MANIKMHFRFPSIFQGGLLCNGYVSSTYRPFPQAQWTSLSSHWQHRRTLHIIYYDLDKCSIQKNHAGDGLCDFCNTESIDEDHDQLSVIYRERYATKRSCSQWRQYYSDLDHIQPHFRRYLRENPDLKDRLSSMLESIRAIESREQVPIKYAIDKSVSHKPEIETIHHPQWRQTNLIKLLKEDLQIVKRSKGWKCNKHRVDAMDWLLWSDPHAWEEKEREREQEQLYASGKSPYRTVAEAIYHWFRERGFDIGWRPDDKSQTDCTGVQTTSPKDKDTVTPLLETLRQMEAFQDSLNSVSCSHAKGLLRHALTQ